MKERIAIERLIEATESFRATGDLTPMASIRTGDEVETLAEILTTLMGEVKETTAALEAEIVQRKAAQSQIAAVLDAAPSAVLLVNKQGRITFFNDGAELLFGYPPEEILGELVEVLVPERMRRGHRHQRKVFGEAPKKRPMGAGRDLVGLRKDGTEVPMEIGLTPLETVEGVFTLVVAIDITDRQHLEELQKSYTRELSRINADLERSNQELDDFAYIASHDLKEPLRGLTYYSGKLIKDHGDQLDDEGKRLLQSLSTIPRRLEELIDSLLHFSRVGRVDLAVEETDLQEELEKVLESLEPRLEEHEIEVRIPRPLPTMRCDRARIGEVFRNLLSNAIKYNDKDDKWIEIGYDGEVFCVSDNGIGIREKHQDRIFRIFKRLHGRDKFGGGVGVGLTIVKKIVEKHGGSIWVESEPDQGTSFFFTLSKHGNP